jgi:hypothetical protein
MSALSVLSEENARRLLCYVDDNAGSGAYIVRFTLYGQDVYVMVDDLFPVDSQGNWLFAHGRDPMEVWPQVIEKAYAKLYGSYEAIAEGINSNIFKW